MLIRDFCSELSEDHRYDAFGEWDGNGELPGWGPALQYVLDTPFEAFGDRPQDWTRRSFPVGCYLRDDRLIPFHRLVKNGHPRLNPARAPLSDGKKRMLAYSLLFDYLLRARYFHILADWRLPDRERRFFERLHACPTAFFAAGTSRPGSDIPHRNCDYVRFCPHCAARAAADLCTRVEQATRECEASFMAAATVSFVFHPPNAEHEDLSQRFQRATAAARAYVRRFADALGMPGGIVATTVGPYLETTHQWDDSIWEQSELDALEVRVGVVGATDLTDNLTFDDNLQCSRLTGLPEDRFLWDWRESYADVKAVEKRSGQIRSLLIGEWPRRLDDPAHPVPWGVLRFHPWTLASQRQWRLARRAAANVQLYTPWGSWIELFRSQRPTRSRLRSNDNLRLGNNARRNDCEVRLSLLAHELRPHVGTERRMTADFVRELARGLGHELSLRNARALAKRFSAP